VTDIKVCQDSACNTELTESSGLKITSNAGLFSLEVDKSVVVADPQITRYFKVISYSVIKIESFTVKLIDCSQQVISLAGEAASPITRELAKDSNVQSLFTAATVSGWFTVSKADPECAITQYQLYKSTTQALTSADTDLYARLQGSSYTNNGAVSIQTNIDAALAEKTVVFYIAAVNNAGLKAVTPSITILLSCTAITSLTTAYKSDETVPAVLPYSADGHLYKIFIGLPGGIKTINLKDA